MVLDYDTTSNTSQSANPQRDESRLYQEYLALKEGAGLVALEGGVLSVGGRDRVGWLQKLTTVNIEALPEGSGAYGLLLNGTAHVIADFVVLALAESFILYTGKNATDKLEAQLRRSVFRDKVTIDRLEQILLLSLQGPHSRRVLDRAFNGLPSLEPFHFARTEDILVIRNARAGAEGYDLLVPRARLDEIQQACIQNGAHTVSAAALNVARIEAGVAWYGEDFDETMLAPEARLDSFLAENKGCYPGQEVIARIHNRGHVNRLLVQLVVEGETVPQRGDLIFDGDREVGWITSSTWSFLHKRPIALGYIRRELAEKGAHVQVQRESDQIAAQVLAI